MNFESNPTVFGNGKGEAVAAFNIFISLRSFIYLLNG